VGFVLPNIAFIKRQRAEGRGLQGKRLTGKSSTFGVVLITLAVMKIAIAYVVDLF